MVSLFKLVLFAGVATVVSSASSDIRDIEFQASIYSGSNDFNYANHDITIDKESFGNAYAKHTYNYNMSAETFIMGSLNLGSFIIPEGSMINYYFGAASDGEFDSIPVKATGAVVSTIDKGDIKKGITLVNPDGSG